MMHLSIRELWIDDEILNGRLQVGLALGSSGEYIDKDEAISIVEFLSQVFDLEGK